MIGRGILGLLMSIKVFSVKSNNLDFLNSINMNGIMMKSFQEVL